MDPISSGGSIDFAKMRQEIFSKIDKDSSGQFDLEEFEAAKPDDGPESVAANIFSKMDANGDGSVTEEEFTNDKSHRR